MTSYLLSSSLHLLNATSHLLLMRRWWQGYDPPPVSSQDPGQPDPTAAHGLLLEQRHTIILLRLLNMYPSKYKTQILLTPLQDEAGVCAPVPHHLSEDLQKKIFTTWTEKSKAGTCVYLHIFIPSSSSCCCFTLNSQTDPEDVCKH